MLVTYDEVGGYGHPDHVMAHRVAMAAVAAAGWRVAKVYCNAVPATVARGTDRGRTGGVGRTRSGRPANCRTVADDQVTHGGAGPRRRVAAKRRALTAHATQVSVSGGWYALSNKLGLPISGSEYYRLVSGTAGGPRDSDGRETDLFGGLDV